MPKFLSYIILKWILLWVYLSIESGDQPSWDWSRVDNLESVFYTFWILLALPILEIIILYMPFYLAIEQKGWLMLLILMLSFCLEFAIGWYGTNQQLAPWMMVKMGLSVGLFCLFYRKQMKLIWK